MRASAEGGSFDASTPSDGSLDVEDSHEWLGTLYELRRVLGEAARLDAEESAVASSSRRSVRAATRSDTAAAALSTDSTTPETTGTRESTLRVVPTPR